MQKFRLHLHARSCSLDVLLMCFIALRIGPRIVVIRANYFVPKVGSNFFESLALRLGEEQIYTHSGEERRANENVCCDGQSDTN